MNESKEAVDLVLTRCKVIGNYTGDPPKKFLTQVAGDIKSSRPSALMPDPYREHIALAVRHIADSGLTDPPAAVAAVYLATRFEFFFRILSGRLTSAGRWLSASTAAATKASLTDPKWAKELERGKRTNWKDERVSHPALPYKIMKLEIARPAAVAFTQMDAGLYPKPIIAHAGDTVADIGDRIAFARHRVSYGEFGDITSESYFYALLTAVCFYNQ